MKQFYKSKRFIVLSIIFVIFATLLALCFVISYYTKPIIYINNAEDFLKIKDDLTASYQLINDINLESEPISSFSDKDHPFTGSFNGNGHTIKNLKLKDPENKDNYTINNTFYYGLFAFNQGQILNTTFVDITFMDISFKETTVNKAYISTIVGNNSNDKSVVKMINIKSELKLTVIGLNDVVATSPFVAYTSGGNISENTSTNNIVVTKRDS